MSSITINHLEARADDAFARRAAHFRAHPLSCDMTTAERGEILMARPSGSAAHFDLTILRVMPKPSGFIARHFGDVGYTYYLHGKVVQRAEAATYLQTLAIEHAEELRIPETPTR
jgi:hypothetical protein